MPDNPTKLITAVGRRVAQLRRARGWTQEKLAEHADVSARYVQLVEAGKENLTLATLAKFARALHVRVAALLETGTLTDRKKASSRTAKK